MHIAVTVEWHEDRRRLMPALEPPLTSKYQRLAYHRYRIRKKKKNNSFVTTNRVTGQSEPACAVQLHWLRRDQTQCGRLA